MVIFSNQNNLGKFLREDVSTFYCHLVYITTILVYFCCHLEYTMVIWYIFPRFGMLYHEKSGNPALQDRHVDLCGRVLNSVEGFEKPEALRLQIQLKQCLIDMLDYQGKNQSPIFNSHAHTQAKAYILLMKTSPFRTQTP
jgi:hypothetical protein